MKFHMEVVYKKTPCMIRLVLYAVLSSTCLILFSQSGPGGVPTTDIVYWFRADQGIGLSGSNISTWTDQSLNGMSAAPGTAPEYVSSVVDLNNQPAIEFANESLVIANSTLINDGNQAAKTMFMVFRTGPSVVSGQEVIYEQGGGTNGLIFYLSGDGLTMDLNMGVYTASGANHNFESFTVNTNTTYIVGFTFDATALEGYSANSTSGITSTIATPSANPIDPLLSHGGDIRIGMNTATNRGNGAVTINANSDFNGQIAELLQFNRVLNSIELDALSNYLASKYDVAISGDEYEGDVPGNGDFDFDVALVGHDGINSQTTAEGGLLTITGSSVSSGQYLLWGHNNGTPTDLTGDYNGVSDNGSGRIWAVDEKGALGTVSLAIAPGNLPTIDAIVIDDNADLNSPEQVIQVNQGTNITVNVDFPDNSISYFSFIQTAEIAVSGNGTDITSGDTSPSLSDGTDFGTIDINSGSNANTFTIENTGTSVLNISSINLNGDHSSDFSLGTVPTSVAGFSSETFEVTFDPSGAGLRAADISIVNDDSDENPFTFDIHGEGENLSEITVSGNGVEITDGTTATSTTDHTYFGNTVGSALERTYTIANEAIASANLTGISVSVSPSTDFFVSVSPATTLTPGNSTTFTVSFLPSARASSIAATVTVKSNDINEDPYTFIVEGSSLEGPGGLSSNLDLWFKADDGVTGETPITGWADQSGNGYDITPNTTVSTVPNLLTDEINFNPAVTFDGSGNYLPLNKNFSNDDLNQVVVFTVFKTDFSNTEYNGNWALLDFDRSDFFNVYLRGEGDLGFSYLGSEIQDVKTSSLGLNDDTPHIGLAIYDNSATIDTRLRVDGLEGDLETGTTAPFTTSDGDLETTNQTMGSTATRYGVIGDGSESTSLDGDRNDIYYDGEIAEIIYYEGQSISDTEIKQIESYLAIKYGITLNSNSDGDATAFEAGEGDYIYVDGFGDAQIIWDADANTAFHNDVAGIGRDDNSTLSQSTSRSESTSSILTVTNSATLVDGEFLLWGHNGNTSTSLTGSYNGGTNNGSARIWAVRETGNMGSVSLIIPAASLPDVDFLLVDNNADLHSPEQIIALTTGANITVDVDFSGNSTSYFGFIQEPEISVTGNGVDIADGETAFGLNDDREFASKDVNVGSGTNTFTINNLGNAELTISSVVLDNTTDFSIVSAPTSVAALSSATLEIQFDPASIGTLSSTVTITNNDDDESVFDFTIQGEGAALPEVEVFGNGTTIPDGDTTPDPADDTFFGNAVGSSIDKTFIISNNASASATLSITTPVTVSGSGTFTISSQPATSVAPGASTTFTVRYTPAGVSSSEIATISITTNDTDENPFNFNVEATSLLGPGGLSDELTLWFKANAEVESSSGVTANNGDPVEYWRDQSPNGYDAAQSTVSERAVFDNVNTINGNPVLTFDGTDDHLAIAGLAYNDVTTLDELTIYAVTQNTDDMERIIVSYDRSSFFRFSTVNTSNFRLGSNQGASITELNSTGASVGNGLPHIVGADFDGVTTGNQNLYYNGALNTTLNTGTGFLGNSSELPRYGFIGTNSEATTFDGSSSRGMDFLGDMAEVIYFESVLSATQRQRVESYLALKYGLTLSTDTDGDGLALEAGEGDYLDSDGNVVWDASANSTYHNLVAGIANDANSGLNQSSSQSVLSGSTLSVTDASLGDKDYIVWGHNGSPMTGQPSGSSYRAELQRVWKIDIAGATDNIDNLSVNLGDLSVTPALASDIALLIDDNSSFTTPSEITANSWSGNVATFSNVDFSAFSGDIFITVAYDLPVPGGVGNNLTLWFRGDSGLEEAFGDDAEDSDFVQYWRDQSGNDYNGQQDNLGNRPRYYSSNTFNFNPVLTFEEESRFSIQDLFYDQSTNTLGNISVYAVTKSDQSDEGIILSFDRSSFFRFALNLTDDPTFGLSTTSGTTDNHNASTSASDGNVHLIQGSYDGTSGQKDLYLDGTNVGGVVASHGTGDLGYAAEVPRFGLINGNSEQETFSADGAGGSGGFVGEIAEIVYFEAALGATERSQVESYLAVKYGITLSGGYVASTGGTVWDHATNTGYNNMIVAVALDQAGSLNQSQSRSENESSILTIGNSALTDGDYIFFGNDHADLSIITTGTGSFDGRFNRIWKFQITGASSTADLSFDLSSVAIHPASVGGYSLLLDDNAAFTSPQEIGGTSLTGDILSFSGVNLSGEVYLALALDPDLDDDGIADVEDLDDDNDGLPDANEGSGAVDTDGDGIVDSRDLDSDNDGIGDLYESGAEDAGTALATLDANNDGSIDPGNVGTNGLDDRLETAADNATLGYTISDSDGEGVLDFRDLDSDNNGISDLAEGGRSTSIDSDDDGVYEGIDVDEDGVPDEVDSNTHEFGAELDARDTDGNSVPDFRDLDNDNDGIEDVDAVGLADTAPDDGRLDGSTDADGDGVWSLRDDDDAQFGFINLADLLTGTGTEWYSYASGEWTDPDNWTTDPSGTTRINPNSLYPNEFNEKVTVLNGDEITLNFDGLVLSSVTINNGGFIDLGTTNGHNFNTINGEGNIKIASDDFPSGDATDFVGTSGGTVIYTDQSPAADYELTTSRIFNNMVVDLAANNLVLKADYTLNSDLTVNSGTMQINDNTSDGFTDNTVPLNVVVNGHLNVNASGSITVGDVDASTEVGSSSGIFTFHQLEVLGDLTNNGSMVLTNLSPTSIADGRYREKYPTASDVDNLISSDVIPTTEFGVAELLFTNGSADQLVTLNGTTDLYRIEVAKGTSQTFTVEINASSTANFRLLGRIAMNQSDDSGNNPNIDNYRALGLEAGTLKLGDNIEIVQIAKNDNIGTAAGTQGGNRNYMIDLDAQLWLASNSSVTKENDWGIHPFGKLKVSDNATLTFDMGTGDQRTILVDNQGVFEQTGGTVNVTQFRNKTGADGAPRGSFVMTGGVMNIGNGGASDGNHGVFSVPWQDQNFILKAADLANPPIINVILDGNRGKDDTAIQIGVKEGNHDVGESTINIVHTSDTDYKMVSTVPFYNLTYDGSSSSAELILANVPDSNGDYIADGGVASDNNSGSTPSPAQDALPLVIRNDLTINDGRFDANDSDITIGNFLTVVSGAEYDPGTNTTLFNGTSSVERILLNGTEPLVGGGFYNLSLTESGTIKEFGGDLATVVVLNDLTIGTGTTLNDNGRVIRVNGDIDHSGFHETDYTSPGYIEVTGGAAAHTIQGDGTGQFKILTINDAVNAISLDADIEIDSLLNLQNGVLNIHTHTLKISSAITDPIRDNDDGTANFGNTRMVRTAGNASDGGLNLQISGSGTYLYPFGVDAYTPAIADVSIQNNNTGAIAINPVSSGLLTTEQSGGNLLDYYWRVNHSDFGNTDLPTINNYTFTFDTDDVPGGTPNTDYVAGKVLDEDPYTRSYEGAAGVQVSATSILFDGLAADDDGTGSPGAGFVIENANYTAGESARFIGSPTVYYSRISDGNSWYTRDWEDGDSWSFVAHDGASDNSARAAAGTWPQAGDIAVIGYGGFTGGNSPNHSVNIRDGDNIEVAQIVYDISTNTQSRVVVWDNATLDFGRITIDGTGTATFMERIDPSDAPSITGDFGDFNVSPDGLYDYYLKSDGTYNITPATTEFPGLIIEGGGSSSRIAIFEEDIVVNENLTVFGSAVVQTSTDATKGDMTISGDLNLRGTFQFAEGADRTIDVGGNLNFINTGVYCGLQVLNATPSSSVHRLIVNGNIQQDQNGSDFDLYGGSGTTDNQVILELQGTGDHAYTRSDGNVPDLYRVVMNKGTDQTSTFTINDTFTLGGTNSGTSKSIEMTSGTLILNNASLDLEVNTGGGDFTIPSDAGLTLQDGTVRISATGTGTGNGMRLDGKLTIAGGNVILNGGSGADNYIEYGSAGSSEIEISSGCLIVGSQFRRNLFSNDGVINYTQSGGKALFGVNAAPDDSRGVFEIVNTGLAGTSSFNLSGASTTLAIVNGQASPDLGTFYIGPDVSVVATNDPYVDFGYNGTVASVLAQNDLNEPYAINSYTALPNIRVDQAGHNSPVLNMIVQPLTITNDVQILNSGSLVANNFDLTVNGGFTNNGTYTPGTNTTTFNGASQTIEGSGATSFYDLDVSTTTGLTLNNTISVQNDLNINTGFLDDNGNAISLLGNLNVTTEHRSPGTGGIHMDGSSEQLIELPDGEAELDYLVINNPNNVTIKDNAGNAVDLTIDDEMAIENGLLQIGDNRVIFGEDAAISSTMGFSSARMISVNGVKKSDGVEKRFAASTAISGFVIPIGVPEKYTPITLDVVDSEDAGSILTKPIDAYHPSADATLTGDPAQIDALSYYWVVTTTPTTVTGFEGSISFQYSEDDANGAGQNEAGWEDNACRLIAPVWYKPSGNLVNVSSNTMTFMNTDLSSFGGTTLDGEYTIGNDIPDNLAQYRSNGSGVWNLSGNWDLDLDGDGFDDGNQVPQPGSIVIIRAGDEVTMSASTDNDQNVFSVNVLGTLDLEDSDGHNFGEVTGTGTIVISDGTLPSGNYDAFFTTTGGSLNLAGSGDYTISPDFANGIRGLIVSEGGVKTLSALTVNVGADGITINDGAELSNALNNNDIITTGDVMINNGTFSLGNTSGSLTAGNLTLANGSFTSIGASSDLSGSVQIDGGTFSAGSGDLMIGGDVSLATAATFVNDNGTITFDGAADQYITGDFSSETMSNVVVNKSSNDLVLASGSSVTIDNILTMTSGNIRTSGATLLLAGGVGSYSRASGIIDGPLQVNLSDADVFSFPVGKSNTYKPLAVSIQDGSQSSNPLIWEVEYYQGSAVSFSSAENSGINMNSIETNANPGEQVINLNEDEYWRIDTGSGSATAETITLDISNIGATQDIINDQELQVMVWDHAGAEWDHLGGISAGDPSSANVVSTLTLGFSEHIVTTGSENSSILPVELLYFSGEAMEGDVYLEWATASEINNDYFEVYHSRDGMEFQVIGRVSGNGTTNVESLYTLIHDQAGVGVNYYRLKQVDFDGAYEYFDIISVVNDPGAIGMNFVVYPNPGTAENINIRVSTVDDFIPVQLRIVDLLGKVLYEEKLDPALSINKRIVPEDKLKPGVYLIEVNQGKQTAQEKLVIK